MTDVTVERETPLQESDLPLPRLQYRWERLPPEDEAYEKEQDVKFITRCHQELIVPTPLSILDVDVPPGTVVPRTISLGATTVTTRAGSGPCVRHNGDAYPQLPFHRMVEPHHVGNPPLIVIGPEGDVWEYVVS